MECKRKVKKKYNRNRKGRFRCRNSQSKEMNNG